MQKLLQSKKWKVNYLFPSGSALLVSSGNVAVNVEGEYMVGHSIFYNFNLMSTKKFIFTCNSFPNIYIYIY